MVKKCLDCGVVLDEPKRKRCHSCVAHHVQPLKYGNKPFQHSIKFYTQVLAMRQWAEANGHLVTPKRRKPKPLDHYKIMLRGER